MTRIQAIIHLKIPYHNPSLKEITGWDLFFFSLNPSSNPTQPIRARRVKRKRDLARDYKRLGFSF